MKKPSIARRLFLKLLGATTATAAGGCAQEQASQTSDVTQLDYEFIVIGSGAGGGPLACNLARAGHRVLLLEAGDDQGHLKSQQVPAFHTKSSEEATMRWDFFVKHYDDDQQARRDSKFVASPGAHHEPGVLYPRAGTLGGCTAHNAMITIYPHRSDWDRIADLTGDASWAADNMRNYFEILENCLYLNKNEEEADGHGFRGWLRTAMADPKIAITDSKLVKIITAAAMAFGFSESFWSFKWFFPKEIVGLLRRDLNNNDPGRDDAEGLFGIPLATDGQKRQGPREFILDTVAKGYPLTVKTNALASKVLFDTSGSSPRAIGVEFLDGAHLYRADPLVDDDNPGIRREVFATREVIVSTGVFNTPQLLKLSGIGPAQELNALGIDVLVDLPGVGTNMQDRYEVGVVSEVRGEFSAVDDCTWGEPNDPCLEDWEEGRGPYESNGAVCSIIKRSFDDRPDPDLVVFGLPSNFVGYYPGYSDDGFSKNHFTWAVLKGHTENSAGTVTLRSTDPRDVPDIRFRYFHEGTNDRGQADRDLDAMVEGVELARKIGGKADFLMGWWGKYDEITPGNSYRDRDDIAEFVRNEAWGHHASCTCPMGRDDDPMAVLDSQLRVRGTAGLRVVDASIFPKIPGFFIVVPIYMVSEKATDMILATLGESR